MLTQITKSIKILIQMLTQIQMLIQMLTQHNINIETKNVDTKTLLLAHGPGLVKCN